MHVFYSEEKRGENLVLKENEVKHFKVRRVGREETFGVIYEGRIYKCKLLKQEGKELICKILEELEVKKPPKAVILYQCITQELKTMDLIVRQATELGVEKFIPVISERSFKKIEVILKRIEKWRRIIVEAMKQSRRAIPMEIDSPVKLEELKPTAEENILLDNFFRGSKPMELRRNVYSFSVVVGAEGGFSEKEGRLLRERGFTPVILEPYTLRTETAVVSIVSILMNC